MLLLGGRCLAGLRARRRLLVVLLPVQEARRQHGGRAVGAAADAEAQCGLGAGEPGAGAVRREAEPAGGRWRDADGGRLGRRRAEALKELKRVVVALQDRRVEELRQELLLIARAAAGELLLHAARTVSGRTQRQRVRVTICQCKGCSADLSPEQMTVQ